MQNSIDLIADAVTCFSKDDNNLLVYLMPNLSRVLKSLGPTYS